jgi:hypothetical protein
MIHSGQDAAKHTGSRNIDLVCNGRRSLRKALCSVGGVFLPWVRLSQMRHYEFEILVNNCRENPGPGINRRTEIAITVLYLLPLISEEMQRLSLRQRRLYEN